LREPCLLTDVDFMAGANQSVPKLKFEPLKMTLDDRQRNWLVG